MYIAAPLGMMRLHRHIVESDVLRNLSNVHSGANRVVAVLDPENGWRETSEHGVIGSRELPVTVVRSTSVPHIAY